MFDFNRTSPPRGPRSGIGIRELTLLLIWIAVNCCFLLHRGIYLQGESTKYIWQAHVLLATGHVETPNFWLYIVEIALIAFCIKFNIGFFFVIGIHLLVNAIATAIFYKTILYLFKNGNTAFLGTLLLLLSIPYQEFNWFLYTESLFYSFTLILTCRLIRIQNLSIRDLLVLFPLVLLPCFTRPTGLLFLLPVSLFLFFTSFRNASAPKKIAVFTGFIVLILFLLDKAIGSGGEFDLMLPFRQQEVICGVPVQAGVVPIRTAENGNSLYGLMYYVWHNPAQFIRLASQKTIAFFGLYRDYYSRSHNLYLLLWFSPIHLAALAGIRYWVKNRPGIFLYLLSVIGLFWLTTMLTCDDWHNRFYLTIVPLLIFLAMPVSSLLLRNNRSKR